MFELSLAGSKEEEEKRKKGKEEEKGLIFSVIFLLFVFSLCHPISNIRGFTRGTQTASPRKTRLKRKSNNVIGKPQGSGIIPK